MNGAQVPTPVHIARNMGDSIRGDVRRVRIPAVFVVDVAPDVSVSKLSAMFPAYLEEVASVVLEGGDLLALGLPFAVVEVVGGDR